MVVKPVAQDILFGQALHIGTPHSKSQTKDLEQTLSALSALVSRTWSSSSKDASHFSTYQVYYPVRPLGPTVAPTLACSLTIAFVGAMFL